MRRRPLWAAALLAALTAVDWAGKVDVIHSLLDRHAFLGAAVRQLGALPWAYPAVGCAALVAWGVWPQTTRASRPVSPVPHEPRRDTTITEAVCWIALRKWGLTVWNDGGGHLDEIIPTVEQVRQAAADGHITIWGKATRSSLFAKIEPEFWHANRIDELSLYRATDEEGGDRGAETSSLRYGGGREFQHLMVSRAEIELEFSER